VTDLIKQLVSDHGLAAVLGIVSIAISLWVAKVVFANLRGQNLSQVRIERDLARLLERDGKDSEPPPPAPNPPRSRRRGVTSLLPRAPTPLPFWPVPQPDEPEPPEGT
jgi:hypothetical protein